MMIFLDNAATTPVLEEVWQDLAKHRSLLFANPSSTHPLGIKVKKHIANLEKDLLNYLGGQRYEIIWTSGGTEANNLAITNLKALANTNKHVVTMNGVHPCVIKPIEALKKQGHEISYIQTSAQEFVQPKQVEKVIKPDTALIALTYVQNEIGAILKLQEIVQIVRNHAPNCHIHIDGVQALGKIPFVLDELDVDSIAFSGHKFHAPGGIGTLICKNKQAFLPMFLGGGQQQDIRSGSMDAFGIHAFCTAALLHTEEKRTHLKKLNQILKEELSQIQAEIRYITPKDAAPHITMISLPNHEAAVLMRFLGAEEIMVSNGSACSAQTKQANPFLTSMGYSEKQAYGALRISFGLQNQEYEIRQFVKTLKQTLEIY